MRAIRAIPATSSSGSTSARRSSTLAHGQFAAELRRLAGDDPRIRFEPAVPSAEIPAVLGDLDALLSPSLWFENGPTIALEAMAVGTPVIATRVGNLAEMIEDGVNGRLVEAGDVAELTAALLEAATQSGVDHRCLASRPAAGADDGRHRARLPDDVRRMSGIARARA